MRIGQLVKLKPYSEVYFSDPQMGSVRYVNECETCYCIFLGFFDHNGTCDVLLDGAVGYNVSPLDLEEVS